MDEKKEYLVKWAGNVCPKVLIAPKLGWNVVAGLLGLTITGTKWRPCKKGRLPVAPCQFVVPSFTMLQLHSKYVDETYDEAAKLLLLSMLLVHALENYRRRANREYVIVPRARLIPGHEYKCDFVIALALREDVSFCVGIVHYST